MRGLFVTGTDTDVGKTFLSALLLSLLRNQGYLIGAYKPVCSGAVFEGDSQIPHWKDVQALSAAMNDEFPMEWICPQRFLAPLAPPVAAQLEGKTIDKELLTKGLNVWDKKVEAMIVEGVGGWKCPLSAHSTIETLAQNLGFPVLVVAAQKLGAINHTLLTIEAIQHAGMDVAGVILNQPTLTDSDLMESNAEQIWKFTNVPFLAMTQFQHQSELSCWYSKQPINLWNVLAPSSTAFFESTQLRDDS